MSVLVGLALLLLIGAGVIVLLTAAVGAIKRDTGHGTSGSMSSTMLEVQSLLEPSKRHTIEAQRQEEEDEDESGGD